MKSLMSLLLLPGVFLSSPALARWLKKEEAGSVVERFYVTYDVKKNGTVTESRDYAMRVQSEDAKTSSSLFTIEYNGLTDKVEVLEAYTRNGDVKVPVEASAIEDRDKGEAKDYDAMKVRSVVFPQVQIGSRLFIRYRVTTGRPLLPDRWSEDLRVGPGLFVEDFKVDITSERPLYWQLHDPSGYIKVAQKDVHHLLVKNKKLLPGWVDGEKEAYFHPDVYAQLWVSTENDWLKFFAGLSQDFSKIQSAGVPPKLRTWVREVAWLKTTDQKILALMEKMSREFRYFGDWRRHDGGLVPRPLQEIEKSRYGDCKDLSSLLTAMLRDMGMQANVALVRRGENAWGHEPDYKLPAVNHFNHAIVQVKDGERTMWLDPTNPVASLEPFADIAGRPAWIMDAKTPHFDRLPEIKATDFTHSHEYDYHFKSGDSVAVGVKADLKKMAAFHIANELMLMPRPEVLTSTMEYFSEGNDISSYRYIKEPKAERTLKDLHLEINFDAQRVTYNAGTGAFFVIPDGIITGPFYETADRESDLKLAETPFSFQGVRRLKGARLAQEAPKPCEVDSNWVRLARAVSVEGSDVLIRQSVELKKPYITRAEFRSELFRKLQEQARRCFYRSGVLIELNRGKG